MDEANGDFRVQLGSPAIDTGKNTALEFDFDGVSRPQDGDELGSGMTGDGSDYDIGAYEFVPSSGGEQGILVTKTSDTNDGVCDSDCSLREAVIFANATAGADIITLPSGEYQLTLVGGGENAALTGDLDVTEDLTIEGDGVDTTTINGMKLHGIFQVTQASGGLPISLNIADVTLRNANDELNGGGGVTFVSSGTLTLENVVMTKHRSLGYGAAVNIANSEAGTAQLYVNNTIFTENCADSGPAIQGRGIWTISNSTFSNNGINFTEDNGDSYTCSQSEVGQGGGALYVQDAVTTISGSTFVGNSAESAGAVFVQNGSIHISNSTMSNNVATGSYHSIFDDGGIGGAIELSSFSGDSTIKNSTFSENSAPSGKAGVVRIGLPLFDYSTGEMTSPSLVMVNSIFANNTASSSNNCYGQVLSQGYNLVDDKLGCDYQAGVGELEVSANLGGFVDSGVPGKGYYPLTPTSSAIDAGDNSLCEATDQLGNSRPNDGDNNGSFVCDIGAHEL